MFESHLFNFGFQQDVITPPTEVPEVINDFDIEEDEIAIENRYNNLNSRQ